MAEVLSPTHYDGISQFGTSPRSFERSDLFIPTSMPQPQQQTTDFSHSQATGSMCCSSSDEYEYDGEDDEPTAVVPSTAPPSPEIGDGGFSASSPFSMSSSSFFGPASPCEEDPLFFPSYDDGSISTTVEPQSAPKKFTPSAPPPKPLKPKAKSAPVTNALPSPTFLDLPPKARDDTEARPEPKRHVDYLSHTWKEEDLWCSYRHVVGKRHVYGHNSRLENAAWRTWGKTRHGLKTVSPVALNWMKDHDTTWLYGPLQIGMSMVQDSKDTQPLDKLSRTDSFTKPILKKRTISEMMLQQSLNSSTLIKQAIAALRSRSSESRFPSRKQVNIGSESRSASERSNSTDSITPSGTETAVGTELSSPCPLSPSEERHISFNDKVEQCIVINHPEEREVRYGAPKPTDEDDEDDMITMKSSPKHAKLNEAQAHQLRNSFCSGNKTIAKLPATTLKYWEEEPEPVEEAVQPKVDGWEIGSKLIHSPSQETLKGAGISNNFLINHDLDEEEDEEEEDNSWSRRFGGRKNSLFVHQSRILSSSKDEDDDEDMEYADLGFASDCAVKDLGNDYVDTDYKDLRRMSGGGGGGGGGIPALSYEEDEDDMMAAGLFGKVIDTVNTARDIAHVLWNTGWQN
ncbi:hypothetical protein MMC25_005041 [Agyrium rufum]|nr:hypothetical protein [Agyrium rufum]